MRKLRQMFAQYYFLNFLKYLSVCKKEKSRDG